MSQEERQYVFSVVPKQTSSPFFTVVQTGCIDQARRLGNVECWYNGTEFSDALGQAQLIRTLAADPRVDGIAVAVVGGAPDETRAAIAFAVQEKGIPVVTFDSDDAGSLRSTYIGTDNYKFGSALGKVLLQIDPTGGTYGVITTTSPNAVEREQGLRDRLKGSKWVEHSSSPKDCQEHEVVGIEKMEEFAAVPELRAILPVGGWPMRNETTWAAFIDDHSHLTTVVADTLPHQMRLLNRGYVTGLVGQVPFQMGSKAMTVLLKYNLGESLPEEILGTSLQEVITVPLDLPEANVDNHQIGNLKYLGFTSAAAVILLSLGLCLWTTKNRHRRIVRASQPGFLIMIAVGAAILGATMIPLSFDDGNMVLDTEKPCVVACMSSVWLFQMGFTTLFSALYSKTWRINKIFHNPASFARIEVSTSDALRPFAALMFANVLTLSLFTALAPLEFVRQPHAGTDDWNRVISTYGTCQTTTDRWGGSTPYTVTLAVINLVVLIVANWQAYRARSIQSEFSESKYIGIVMASMLQTFIMAIPILFLVRESPEVLYVLSVCTVLVICAVTLLCIFLPKVTSNTEENNRFSVALPSSRQSTGQQSFQSGLWSANSKNQSFAAGLQFTSTVEKPFTGSSGQLDFSKDFSKGSLGLLDPSNASLGAPTKVERKGGISSPFETPPNIEGGNDCIPSTVTTTGKDSPSGSLDDPKVEKTNDGSSLEAPNCDTRSGVNQSTTTEQAVPINSSRAA